MTSLTSWKVKMEFVNERSVGVLHRLLGASWRGGLEAVAVIVDEDGHASIASADELGLYAEMLAP